MKRLGLLILFLIIAFNIGMSGYYYDVLPGRVASRFNFEGEPIAWMPKATFVIFNVVLLLAMPLFLLSLSWLSMKLPNSMINLPHRDYWLAPERKRQTAASFFVLMLWLTVAVELFLTAIVGLVYRANMGHPNLMRETPFYFLGGFLAVMIVWVLCFYMKFKRIPPE
jgi:uncharacterized membrane protein